MTRILPWLVALLALLAGTTLYWINRPATPVNLASGTLITPARDLAPVTLEDHTGKDFTPQDWQGQWSWVFFGFTHCPDICPNTLYLFTQLKKITGQTPQPVRYVFFTVDPQRDTREVMQRYLAFYDPDFIGLRSNAQGTQDFTRPLGIAYFLHQADEEGNYAVDHSAHVMLINPNGQLQAVFSPPVDPRKMQADLTQLMQNWPR